MINDNILDCIMQQAMEKLGYKDGLEEELLSRR